MEFEKRANGRMACPFDHHSPDFAQRLPQILDELQEHAPIAWSDSYGGFWIVTRHDLVRKIAMDSVNFTVAPGEDMTGGLVIPAAPTKNRPLFVPGEADGDEHDMYRLALNPMFSKQKVNELRPLIERHVSQTIDRILEQGEFDVIADLAQPIVAGISCEHLGLEVGNPQVFLVEVEHAVNPLHEAGSLETIERKFDEAWELLSKVIQQKRVNPSNDVISHLAHWKEPELSDDEIRMMTINVILGAALTTGTLISQAVLYLDRDRVMRERLSREPELVKPAIDEFLRFISPSMGVARTATADVALGGVTMRAGDRVLLSYYAANHDPARYASPHAFDLERGAQQNLSLGVGAHFCLGAWLAKSITAVTLREVLLRMPGYRVDIERGQRAQDLATFNYWLTMPSFTK
jgi:cytochrome P450